jgi:hypothetical protein
MVSSGNSSRSKGKVLLVNPNQDRATEGHGGTARLLSKTA